MEARPLGLLVVVHGSRYPGTLEQLSAIVDALKALRPGDAVGGAFLEILQPSVDEGLSRLFRAGCTSIVILPYLMLDGRHSREDLPRLAREAEAHHPGLSVRVGPPLGVRKDVLQLLLAGAGLE